MLWALTENCIQVNIYLSSYRVRQTFEQASTSLALNESLAKCFPSVISLSILWKDEHVYTESKPISPPSLITRNIDDKKL